MLQLEKKKIEYQGEPYEVCCNMRVLEDLQTKYGDMKTVFGSEVNKVAADLFVIMLNRARAKCGEAPITLDDIAEDYNPAMIQDTDVFGMFLRAMSADTARQKLAADAEAKGKN